MRRRALLLAAPLLPAAAVAAAEDALARLLRRMAAVPRRRDRFEEERVVPELDVPVPSAGTLRWDAPDRLEKHTTAPSEERLVVQGDRLLWERPARGQRRDFALAEQPEMAALAESVRAILAGDLAALLRHWEPRLAAAPDGSWTLLLLPRSARLRGAVQRVTLHGRGDAVLEVHTQEGGGTARMRIIPGP